MRFFSDTVLNIATIIQNYDNCCQLSFNYNLVTNLNPFVPDAPFLNPPKTSTNLSFLKFSRGRERVHWEQMG